MAKNDIKNFVIIGHASSGKTTLIEALLYNSGATKRPGDVDQGNSILDFDPQEIKRKITINLSVASSEWNGNKIYFIDTPGFLDFEGEVRAGIRAADNAICVVDPSQGPDVGTERFFEIAKKKGIPVIFVITKMKSFSGEIDEVISQMKDIFGAGVTPVQIPEGQGEEFSGVKDLLKSTEDESLKESIIETSEELLDKYMAGEEITEEELKEAFKKGLRSGDIYPVLFVDSKAGVGVKELLDFLADYGLTAFESVKEKGNLKDEEVEVEPNLDNIVLFVFKVLQEAHLGELYFVKVVCGEMKPGIELLNTTKGKTEKINQLYEPFGKERREVKSLLPGSIGLLVKLKETETGDTLATKDYPVVLNPLELPEPLVNVAIVPKTREDQEKVMEGLNKLKMEDPTFYYKYDTELKQTQIFGLGEVHLDVIVSKLKEKFNVDVNTEKPKIPYRESIRKKAEGFGKFVKQTGGHGQYGICNIRIEPLPRDQEYEFKDEIFGGAIPSQFIPSVEAGVKKAMERGVLGARVVNVRVVLYDGKYHPVDSSNFAFEVAGSLAFKDAEEKADPYLLEPIYLVEVKIPERYMGDVIGDLNARRGRILGMEAEGRYQKIKAYVPLAELYRYSSTLRSITKGRGTFTMRFDHYDEVPREIAQKVIEELKKEQESE